MSKAADAFRTISEVAEDLDIPQHVLRFWETRFTSIRPLKRGGGRRYYRPDDVELLRGIRHLLYGQGYTIKGVQRILKEEGARAVQDVGRGGSVPARGPEIPVFEQDDREVPGADGPPGYPRPAVSVVAAGPVPDGRPSPAAHAASARAEARLEGSDLERLHAALAELHECRRIMETLRRH